MRRRRSTVASRWSTPLNMRTLRALAHYNLGRVLFAQGRMPDALPHFREALRIGSSYAKMYLEIGAIYDTLGLRSAAQASYATYRELVGERGAAVGLAND